MAYPYIGLLNPLKADPSTTVDASPLTGQILPTYNLPPGPDPQRAPLGPNAPYTFFGPSIDAAISNGVRSLGSGAAGAGSPTVMPPPAVDGPILPGIDVPTNTAAPSPAAINVSPALATRAAAAPQQGIRSVAVPGAPGMSLTPGADGSRTYSMGVPGQPGSGTMTVLAPIDRPAPTSGVTPGGLQVSGDPGTVARFMAPVSAPAGMRDTGRMIQAVTGSDMTPPAAPTAPQYLGPESGLGWKTRLAIYQAQMGAANQQAANATHLQTAAMTNANQQQIATDKLNSEQPLWNSMAAENNVKAATGMRLVNAANALSAAKPGTPEYNQAMQNYMLLSGQGAALAKENKPDVKMMKVTSPDGLTVTEVPIVMNPTGTGFVKSQDLSPSTQINNVFDQMLAADPKALKAFQGKTPLEQQALRNKFLQDRLAAGGK